VRVDGALATEVVSVLVDVVSVPLPGVSAAVTIGHLLTHTSGVYDYLDEEVIGDPDDFELPIAPSKLLGPRDYLPMLVAGPAKFEPGARFSYSNGGFVLLGLALEEVDGGILESFGRLFKNNLKLFVYPFMEPRTKKLMTVETLDLPQELRQLYGYLIERGCIVQLTDVNHAYLDIHSHEVLRKIGRASNEWEAMVPPEVAAAIKARGLFGYG